jgi:hypothetical protein
MDDAMLRCAIADLVKRKRAGEELDRAPRVPIIGDFIEAELACLAAGAPEKRVLPEISALDGFFRRVLFQSTHNHP